MQALTSKCEIYISAGALSQTSLRELVQRSPNPQLVGVGWLNPLAARLQELHPTSAFRAWIHDLTHSPWPNFRALQAIYISRPVAVRFETNFFVH